MSEKKIQLPGFVIADLYRNSLVVLDDTISPPPGQPSLGHPAPRQWYLGNNGKNITIVVKDGGAVFLGDESLQFLSSILGACKLNLGDVAIVNLHHEPVAYSYLKQQLLPRHLLLFDVTTQQVQLPFMVPHYQVQQYDQCQFLLAPSLQVIAGNSQEARLEKSKLWLSLKKMFNI